MKRILIVEYADDYDIDFDHVGKRMNVKFTEFIPPTDKEINEEKTLSDAAENETLCKWESRWDFYRGAIFGANWMKDLMK